MNRCIRIHLPRIARPRTFRSKDRSFQVIFRVIFPDRSVTRGQRIVKRRKGKRWSYKKRWRGRRKRDRERLVEANRNRRSLEASPWLRSVAGYGQLFFTLRANDRYVFCSKAGRILSSSGLSLLVLAFSTVCLRRTKLRPNSPFLSPSSLLLFIVFFFHL